MTTQGQGVCLRFYVHENRRQKGILFNNWLLDQAKKMGLHGGTAYHAIAGYDCHGVMYEKQFFELTGDLTVRLGFVVATEDAKRLVSMAETEELTMSYIEFPVEFRAIGNYG